MVKSPVLICRAALLGIVRYCVEPLNDTLYPAIKPPAVGVCMLPLLPVVLNAVDQYPAGSLNGLNDPVA